MQQLFALPDAFSRPFHPAAPGERILKIRFHVGNAVGAAHPDRIFKVMVQAAVVQIDGACHGFHTCLLYTSPSPRDGLLARMPSSA